MIVLIQTQQRLEEWGKRMDLRVCINPSYTPTEIWTPTLSHKWHLQRWKGGFNDGNGIEKKKNNATLHVCGSRSSMGQCDQTAQHFSPSENLGER